MKRLLTTLILLVLCITLCACSSSSSLTAQPTATPSPEIQLTHTNITDYLSITWTFSSEYSGDTPRFGGYATATLDIYPIVGGYFNNTQVIVDCSTSSPGTYHHIWQLADFDPAYKYIAELDEDLHYTITDVITLPADGKITKTYALYNEFYGYRGENPLPKTQGYSLTSQEERTGCISSVKVSSEIPEGTPLVKGTFVPAQ